MANPLESEGVEAEKAEAMRNYNSRSSKSFRNIIQAIAVASLVYLWFPTVTISLQTVADWFYRTGSVIVTNRTVVFVVANLLVGLIFVLSRDDNDEISTSSSSDTKPDLYEQYTSSSTVTVTVEKTEDDDDSKKQIVTVEKSEEEDDSKKQIVAAFVEKAVTSKGIYRRTKSEKKRKEIIRPTVTEFRRTESAKVVAMERLSSDEFRLKVERFIMEKKRSLVKENDAVLRSRPWLDDNGAAFGSGYGSC